MRSNPQSAILTDFKKTRTVPDAEARLYEDLEWAGLEWDEGLMLIYCLFANPLTYIHRSKERWPIWTIQASMFNIIPIESQYLITSHSLRGQPYIASTLIGSWNQAMHIDVFAPPNDLGTLLNYVLKKDFTLPTIESVHI